MSDTAPDSCVAKIVRPDPYNHYSFHADHFTGVMTTLRDRFPKLSREELILHAGREVERAYHAAAKEVYGSKPNLLEQIGFVFFASAIIVGAYGVANKFFNLNIDLFPPQKVNEVVAAFFGVTSSCWLLGTFSKKTNNYIASQESPNGGLNPNAPGDERVYKKAQEILQDRLTAG